MVVVMVVINVMMVMMVMLMVLHRRRRLAGGRRWGGGRRFLRDGVTGEAERERGGRDKGLDHGRTFLWLGNPNG
jgi:hypothetical protein